VKRREFVRGLIERGCYLKRHGWQTIRGLSPRNTPITRNGGTTLSRPTYRLLSHHGFDFAHHKFSRV
jgi:hypothetical protein